MGRRGRVRGLGIGSEKMPQAQRQPFAQRLRGLFAPVDLTHGNISGVLIRFSIPIVLSNLLQQIYTLSDAAICGQTLTAGEVAGINDTSPLLFMVLQFAFGCATGFSVVTANRVGERDEAGVRRSFAAQLLLCGGLTLLLSAAAIVFLNPLLSMVNVTPQNAEVYRAAYTYCLIIFLGIGAQLFYNVVCSLLRSTGDSFTPLVFLFFSTLLNILLDFLFILGFGWGVAGAAVATVAAQFCSAVACFAYTFIKYKALRLHHADFRMPCGELWRHFRLGLPLGLQFSVLAVGVILMMGQVVRFDLLPDGMMVAGAPAQNGFGAANKMINFLMSPFWALGAALVSFNAQNLGAGDLLRVRKGTDRAFWLAMLLYVICAVVGLLLSIGGAYQYIFLSPDKISAESVTFGNLFLYADLPLFCFVGILMVWRSAVQGVGKPIYTLFAGIAELAARIVISLFLPVAVGGMEISALAPKSAFYALCLADPGAWLLAALVLLPPYIYYIVRPARRVGESRF